MRHRWSLGLGVLALLATLAGCVPGQSPATPTTASPAPSAAPTAPPSPTASASPRPAVSPLPSPSPSPSPGPGRYATIVDANAAFARGDYSTALRLYRQAANSDTLIDTPVQHNVPPGPDLRAFARFRIVVTDAIVGQEDDARAILEEMRQKDAATPFLRLALTFWDTYGMTADPRAACGQVTRMVRENPVLYLRSLSGWGGSNRDLGPDDVCQVPPS